MQERGGGSEDGDARERNKKKKVRQCLDRGDEEKCSFEGGAKSLSYRDKLLDIAPKTCSFDGRGSNVFEEAWREHIEGLKSFFGDGKERYTQVAEKEGSNEDDDDDVLIPTLVVTQEEYERWCAPWRKSLIIKLLGKDIPIWGMKVSLKRLWKTKELFEVRDLDNGYFVVSFLNDEDLNYVYFDGPWMVSDHYLLVQRWRPNFDPWNAETQQKIAAWIRIPLLPLEFFNAESLNKIGRLIGKTLKVDSITYLMVRGRYARICVELDLKKRLKPAVEIFGKNRHIEYKGLLLVCFKCGKYGYHRDACSEVQGTKVTTERNVEETSSNEGRQGVVGAKGTKVVMKVVGFPSRHKKEVGNLKRVCVVPVWMRHRSRRF